MSAGTPDEGEGGSGGSPPDPLDRLWIHPAELGSRARAPRVSPRGSGREWAIALVAGAVGALVTVTTLAAFGTFDGHDASQAETTREQRADNAELVARVVAQAGPSVVGIALTTAGGTRRASGVAIGDGRIITSSDAVDGVGTITVTTVDGRQAPARVAGADPATDLALVRVDQLALPAARFGSADSLQVGRQVIAVGVGLDQHWVSTGVISSLDGLVEVRPGRMLAEMVQTDNSITPQAGGGALVDQSGTVVGILVSVRGTSGGLATPANVVSDVADQLTATGHAEHGWLGIAGEDHDGHPDGVLVTATEPGSPAARAGLVAGMVLTDVDGRPVDSMAELMAAVRPRRPGDTIGLTYSQAGRIGSVDVTLGTWTDASQAATPTTSGATQAVSAVG